MTTPIRSAVAMGAPQFNTAESGASTMKMTSTTTWIQKQPRPGPRSGLSGAPLYSGICGVSPVVMMSCPPATPRCRRAS